MSVSKAPFKKWLEAPDINLPACQYDYLLCICASVHVIVVLWFSKVYGYCTLSVVYTMVFQGVWLLYPEYGIIPHEGTTHTP